MLLRGLQVTLPMQEIQRHQRRHLRRETLRPHQRRHEGDHAQKAEMAVMTYSLSVMTE